MADASDGDVDHAAAKEAGEAMERKDDAASPPLILTDEELPILAEGKEPEPETSSDALAAAPASAEAKGGGSDAIETKPVGMSVEVKDAGEARLVEAKDAEPSAAAAEAKRGASESAVALRSEVEVELSGGHNRHVWPEASGVSLMCDAKNHRIRAEADMKLLANRLQHLQVAEERARKKIAETKSRTNEIMGLKQRNLEYQTSKQKLHTERELNVSATRRAVTLTRQTTRRHVRESRSLVEQQRSDHATRQRDKMASLKGAHQRDMGDLVDRNRALNRQALSRRAEAKRRKDELRAETDRRRKEEYAKQIQLESTRAIEAERLIQEMTQHEHRLMDRLKETQTQQTKAYEDLQTSLQL